MEAQVESVLPKRAGPRRRVASLLTSRLGRVLATIVLVWLLVCAKAVRSVLINPLTKRVYPCPPINGLHCINRGYNVTYFDWSRLGWPVTSATFVALVCAL